MREDLGITIAVASGKGGTGKTTVATNLAASLQDVQVLDCDVEDPNCNLFFRLELEKVDDVVNRVPRIDLDKCDFCGECSRFCQYNAIAVLPHDVLVFEELCRGCGGCVLVCPRAAITEKEKPIGRIEKGRNNSISFYRGILNVGEPMAEPVIHQLKKRIDNSKDAILDSPPGTSCPVIEVLRGSDFCLLVTEPTPFGLYDLKIAVEVARNLDIPHGVILNRYGIGDKRVDEYCEKEGIPILLRIPDSRRIARICSEGHLFVEEMPNWKEEFLKLFESIKRELGQ